MRKNNTIQIGLPGILTTVFIGLKLTNNIDWSWWWVFSPLWISIILGLILFAVVFLYALRNNKINEETRDRLESYRQYYRRGRF